MGDPVVATFNQQTKVGDRINLPLIGYGPSRLSMSARITAEQQRAQLANPVVGLLDVEAGNLINIENWLLDRRREIDEEALAESSRQLAEKRMSSVLQALKQLMPYVADIRIRANDIEYLDKTTWRTSGKLSAGHKNILAMIGDMMVRLYHFNAPETEDVGDLHGVVLIDEFEAHLHPRWQYALPNLLRETFPKIQFIASTHSPIPLLGAPVDTLLLKVSHDAQYHTVIERLDIALGDMQPNSLLTSPLFGLDSLFSPHHPKPEEIQTENDFREVLSHQNRDEYRKWSKANVQFPENFFKLGTDKS